MLGLSSGLVVDQALKDTQLPLGPLLSPPLALSRGPLPIRITNRTRDTLGAAEVAL
jgi:hypothetical protein